MHVKASGFAVFVLVNVLYMPLAVTITPNPVQVFIAMLIMPTVFFFKNIIMMMSEPMRCCMEFNSIRNR